MRLRRFEAATVTEALARVREDLGPNAVILHARAPETVRASGGASGRVEVMAAVDDEPTGAWNDVRTPRNAARGRGADGVEHPVGPRLREPVEAVDERVAEPARLEEMYRMLLELRDESIPAPRLPAALQPLYRELCRREVPAAVARRLLSKLPAETRSGRAARPVLQAALMRAFRVQRAAPAVGRRRVVALVGPTGVGKTTTIAKLAGQCRHVGRQRVALVSLDTYRIGAVAQMQIYAELLGAPLHVVRNPGELACALRAEAGTDLVLVDTMGRSPRHREGIAGLRGLLRELPDPEVHLVVSSTTKGSDLEEVMRQFQPLEYQHVLITKLDEARSLGPVLGLALQRDLSISYLTTGQGVPDDLEPATARRLATCLLPDGAASPRRDVARA